jgi:hypothetical protein
MIHKMNYFENTFDVTSTVNTIDKKGQNTKTKFNAAEILHCEEEENEEEEKKKPVLNIAATGGPMIYGQENEDVQKNERKHEYKYSVEPYADKLLMKHLLQHQNYVYRFLSAMNSHISQMSIDMFFVNKNPNTVVRVLQYANGGTLEQDLNDGILSKTEYDDQKLSKIADTPLKFPVNNLTFDDYKVLVHAEFYYAITQAYAVMFTMANPPEIDIVMQQSEFSKVFIAFAALSALMHEHQSGIFKTSYSHLLLRRLEIKLTNRTKEARKIAQQFVNSI